MLKIRLQRVGRKHEPSFRLVLTESENATKSGRFKEILGSYDPRKTTEFLKSDRIQYWLSQGVGMTGVVQNLLIDHKIISTPKARVTKIYKPAPAAPVAPAEEIVSVPETPTESTEPAQAATESDENAIIEDAETPTA